MPQYFIDQSSLPQDPNNTVVIPNGKAVLPDGLYVNGLKIPAGNMTIKAASPQYDQSQIQSVLDRIAPVPQVSQPTPQKSVNVVAPTPASTAPVSVAPATVPTNTAPPIVIRPTAPDIESQALTPLADATQNYQLPSMPTLPNIPQPPQVNTAAPVPAAYTPPEPIQPPSMTSMLPQPSRMDNAINAMNQVSRLQGAINNMMPAMPPQQFTARAISGRAAAGLTPEQVIQLNASLAGRNDRRNASAIAQWEAMQRQREEQARQNQVNYQNQQLLRQQAMKAVADDFQAKVNAQAANANAERVAYDRSRRPIMEAGQMEDLQGARLNNAMKQYNLQSAPVEMQMKQQQMMLNAANDLRQSANSAAWQDIQLKSLEARNQPKPRDEYEDARTEISSLKKDAITARRDYTDLVKAGETDKAAAAWSEYEQLKNIAKAKEEALREFQRQQQNSGTLNIGGTTYKRGE